MAHWLDGILNPGVTIEWDGDPIPRTTVLNFDEEFAVDYDAATQKATVSIRFLSMEGDVNGDSDENLVTKISGDEDTNTVAVFATGFQWDSDAAETEPALIIGEDGAIELWNDGKRSVAASADGPVLGNTTAINKLVGGLQVTRQFINGNVTLDASTKATLLVINAATEHTITFPAPSDARVFFWVVIGTANQTFARHGSENFNGVASNYTPQDNSRGIVFSDGVDWYTLGGLE